MAGAYGWVSGTSEKDEAATAQGAKSRKRTRIGTQRRATQDPLLVATPGSRSAFKPTSRLSLPSQDASHGLSWFEWAFSPGRGNNEAIPFKLEVSALFGTCPAFIPRYVDGRDPLVTFYAKGSRIRDH